MFADKEFSNSINMSGVNSINWARIIAQSVYYFYTYFQIKDDRPINFSVPTGNFGDVYAGYLSKKMGLPINKLIVATNQNDILHRAISSGKYETEVVLETNSPSMDIQIASNFERLIYDLNDFDDHETQKVMSGIKEKGKYIISKDKMEKINKDFLSASINENEVLDIIKEVHAMHNTVLDPHSAIGFGALKKVNIEGNNIVLATAHPCKFPEAIDKSIGIKPSLPGELKYVMDEKENYDIIANNLSKTKQYIKEKIL
jgi:threonine synthase